MLLRRKVTHLIGNQINKKKQSSTIKTKTRAPSGFFFRTACYFGVGKYTASRRRKLVSTVFYIYYMGRNLIEMAILDGYYIDTEDEEYEAEDYSNVLELDRLVVFI